MSLSLLSAQTRMLAFPWAWMAASAVLPNSIVSPPFVWTVKYCGPVLPGTVPVLPKDLTLRKLSTSVRYSAPSAP
jgi:hypothetical protein